MLRTWRGLGIAPGEACFGQRQTGFRKAPRRPCLHQPVTARPARAVQAGPARPSPLRGPLAFAGCRERAPTLPHSRQPRPDRVTVPGKSGISCAAALPQRVGRRTGLPGLIDTISGGGSRHRTGAERVRRRPWPDAGRRRIQGRQQQEQHYRNGCELGSGFHGSASFRSNLAPPGRQERATTAAPWSSLSAQPGNRRRCLSSLR